MYAVVLAPAVWILAAVGFTQDLTTRGRDDFAVESLGGLSLLLLAGAAYAILLLAPISPAGPLLAGLAFVGVSIWALADPAGYAALWPANVAKDGFDLSRPAYGLAAMLAIPLVCTALSARRWERYEPPVLPLIGQIGRFRAAVPAPTVPAAVLETTVLRSAADADRTTVLRSPSDPDRTTVLPSTSDPDPTTVMRLASQRPSADSTTAVVVPISTPAIPGSDPTVVVRSPSSGFASGPSSGFASGPSAGTSSNDATVVVRDNAEPVPATAQPEAEAPTEETASDEPTAATAVDEPTAATADDEPSVADDGDEVTAVAATGEPTAADDGDEATAVTAADEPTVVAGGGEATAVTATDEPTVVTPADEQTVVTATGERTVTTAGDEPTTVIANGEPTVATVDGEATTVIAGGGLATPADEPSTTALIESQNAAASDERPQVAAVRANGGEDETQVIRSSKADPERTQVVRPGAVEPPSDRTEIIRLEPEKAGASIADAEQPDISDDPTGRIVPPAAREGEPEKREMTVMSMERPPDEIPAPRKPADD
ncbi:hypothetical protein ACQPZJ_05430 [Actinoplanes sp. CA-054009]